MDELIQAVRWKLGLPHTGSSQRASDIWRDFVRHPRYQEIGSRK